MNCPNCNKENPSGAQFCSGCGAELSANSRFAKFCEVVMKRSKIAFVLMHIANVVFSLIAVPCVIAHSFGPRAVMSVEGEVIYISLKDFDLGVGLLFGILLFVTNIFVIRFLKSVVDLFVAKNSPEN